MQNILSAANNQEREPARDHVEDDPEEVGVRAARHPGPGRVGTKVIDRRAGVPPRPARLPDPAPGPARFSRTAT